MPAQNEQLFGKMAVDEGHITHKQLQECLALKAQTRSDKTLWEILVEKSYLDYHTTNQLLGKVERQETVIKAKRKVEKFFGDIAVSRDFCTAEQMEQAIAEQKGRMQSGRNQRLGEVCVEMGILTAEQVALVLGEQNRSIVACEGCGSAYNVEGFPAGKRWRCKVCNAMLEVPGAPAFSSVPIDQLLSEQFEDVAEQQPEKTSAAAEEAPARTEKTRFGNYYIIEKIARGGMGIIYKARQRGLDRIVALKVLIAGESASEEAIKRFYLEAKSVAKLRHPNIVPIYEVGIHNGKHFFTMDFIHGENLRHVILNQKVNVHWALELCVKVARALHYAHEHGLVHRDVKPENILIDETGEPQITDFGLAKDVEMDANLTRAGLVMGTPAYMSPEQARGEREVVDRRTDIYSLGAILYEMLTGRKVFKFEGPVGLSTLLKTISQDPVPPRRVNPRIPREVETIVMKTLEKDPERRYENAEGFAEDIDRYLSGEPILAKPPSFTYRTWKKMKKYKVVSVSVLTAVIAIVAVAVYFINERIEIKKRQDARFREYIEKAQGLLAGGDYVGAKSLYIQAKTLRPDDLKVARGLDKVQLGIREREKNRDEREAKERAADAASEGNDMLEKARQATDRFDAKTKYFDAMREFDRALANDSNNEDGKLGKYNAAVELGELNMQDKDFGVAMLMFSFAEGLGVNDKKAKELVGAARKARQRAEAFVSLLEKANQLMAAGSWDEAVRHLERAIEFEGITVAEKQDVQERIRETSYSRYFWEGETERKKGNTVAAIAAFLKAETFKDTPEVAERLRSVRYGRSVRKGNDHLVREEFTEALKAYLQARQYADNPAEAIELIEQCRDRGFNHCSALAMAAKASRDWMEAGEHLKQALTFRPENLGTRKLKAEVAAAAACPEKPEKMVYVFSSKLTVGSAVLDDRNSLREVFVDFFYIDRFEVTNKRYKVFVGAGGYSQETYWDSDGYKQIEAFVDRTGKPGPATWENGTFPQGKEDFPVTGVSWYEARAYARWAGKRLPTEEEWEKAASCDPEETGAKLTYPWGDDWDPDKGNFKDDEVTKVGSFPNDVSPAGCFDMGGNAFEWTSSSYKEEYRVIRGGSVGLSESTLKRFARITKRKCPKPSYRSRNTGFRCALTPER